MTDIYDSIAKGLRDAGLYGLPVRSYSRNRQGKNTYCINHAAVYISDLKRFYAISVEDLRASRIDHKTVSSLFYALQDSFSYRTVVRNRIDCREPVVYVHGFEEYRRDHPHSAIEYLEEYCDEIDEVNPDIILLTYTEVYRRYPYMEQLIKSGYISVVYDICLGFDPRQKHLLFRPGTDMTGITGLWDYEWRALAGNVKTYAEYTDAAAVIEKYHPARELLDRLCALHAFDSRLLSVLGYEWEGQPVYTLEQLVRYLEQAGRKQYILPKIALEQMDDYLRMCGEVNRRPVVRNRDLRRDHDVMAAEHRKITEEANAERLQEGFKERYRVLKDLEWEDDRLCVIAPEKPEDLYREGKQNHNCVASYADDHASGETNIFMIRKKESPEDSYITLELKPDFRTVNQVYYSYNREISRQDQDFVSKWIETIQRRTAE